MAVWVTRPLAAVGRMALTNYILQTVICMTLFCGFGFGWFGQLARHQLYYVVCSRLGVPGDRQRPLAALVPVRAAGVGWRSLTYVRRQPLRMAAKPPALTLLMYRLTLKQRAGLAGSPEPGARGACLEPRPPSAIQSTRVRGQKRYLTLIDAWSTKAEGI